jgi:hypothetical protein
MPGCGQYKSHSPRRRRGRGERQKATHRKGARDAKKEYCRQPANLRYQYFTAEDNSLYARAIPVAFRETPPVLQKNLFLAPFAPLR